QRERHEAVNRAIERFVGEKRTSWREKSHQEPARPWISSYSKDTPATIPIPRQPMHRFLESAADWRPKQTATIFYGSKMSYRELNEKANQFANTLRKLDVKM